MSEAKKKKILILARRALILVNQLHAEDAGALIDHNQYDPSLDDAVVALNVIMSACGR